MVTASLTYDADGSYCRLRYVLVVFVVAWCDVETCTQVVAALGRRSSVGTDVVRPKAGAAVCGLLRIVAVSPIYCSIQA